MQAQISHQRRRWLWTGLLGLSLCLSTPVNNFMPGMSIAQAEEAPAASPDYVQNLGKGKVNWTAGTLMATGSGVRPDRGSDAQKRLLAKRAAIADAYRQLGEVIEGVNVNSTTTVKDFVATDEIRTQMSAFIKGARIMGTRELADGTIEVDLQAPLYGSTSLSSILQPALDKEGTSQSLTGRVGSSGEMIARAKKVKPPKPKPTAVPVPKQTAEPHELLPAPSANEALPAPLPAPIENANGYSGIVIDCRGLNMEPAMSPTILDEGGAELYIGKRPIDPDFVVNYGIVGYLADVDAALAYQERVGSKPLLIKGVRNNGPLAADVVLDAAAAAEMLKANDMAGDFLSKSKVIFVL